MSKEGKSAMLNMEGLREFGADVDEGLERCETKDSTLG